MIHMLNPLRQAHESSVKFALFLALLLSPVLVHAEILILLPEQGPLAPAANSVKEGLTAAYYAGTRRPTLRFVDSSDQPMDILLAKEIKADTELVIGPLARDQVGELVNTVPSIPVLALNEVAQTQKNVWQFALAPDEDANTLLKSMRADGVTQLSIITQHQFVGGQRFRVALLKSAKLTVNDLKTIPSGLQPNQGLLVLGSSEWVSHQILPHERVYAPALVFDHHMPVPAGLEFCDTPALLRADWPELNALNKTQPATSEILRLRAFGADAWQIALLLLDRAPSARFAGRTGLITLTNQDIHRTPMCFRATTEGLIPRS